MEILNDIHLNKSIINSSISIFNFSNETNEFLDTPWITTLIIIVATVISATTIFGNILVITAFVIDKNLRKYPNYFILNLSIADLLIGLLIPPYSIFLIYNRVWKLGRVACTVWLVLDYVVGSASVLCIVVISLDRYLLVSKGLKYLNKQTTSKAIAIMIIVWLIAFINYAPAIIFWEPFADVKSSSSEGQCQVAFHNDLFYLTLTACVEFFVPLVSICALNIAVYLNIRKRSRGLIQSENKSKKESKKKQSIVTNSGKKLKVSIALDPNLHVCKFDNKRNDLNEILPLKSVENSFNSDDRLKPIKIKTIPKKKNTNNEQMNSKVFLRKDKKAARSLFILVIVFVLCWVRFLFLIQM